jgi:tRNA(fMet)-specific endonuclease VapC
LDTDHVSVVHHKERPAFAFLEARLNLIPVADIHVSIVSFQEQAHGWLAYLRRARKPHEVLKGFADLQDVLRYYATQKVLAFDQVAMDEFTRLHQQRIRIGTSDLRITAIANANGVKLLSRNLRDFRRVPGLDVEDWTA